MIRLSEEAVGVGPTKQRARARPTRVPGRASCSSQTFPGPLVPLVSPVSMSCVGAWASNASYFNGHTEGLVSCDATKYLCPSLTRGRRHRRRASETRRRAARRGGHTSHTRVLREKTECEKRETTVHASTRRRLNTHTEASHSEHFRRSLARWGWCWSDVDLLLLRRPCSCNQSSMLW